MLLNILQCSGQPCIKEWSGSQGQSCPRRGQNFGWGGRLSPRVLRRKDGHEEGRRELEETALYKSHGQGVAVRSEGNAYPKSGP